YAAEAAHFIPSAEMPATLKAGAKRSAELVSRYPKDPRAHLIQAYALVEARRNSDAEGGAADHHGAGAPEHRGPCHPQPGAGYAGGRRSRPGPAQRSENPGRSRLQRQRPGRAQTNSETGETVRLIPACAGTGRA